VGVFVIAGDPSMGGAARSARRCTGGHGTEPQEKKMQQSPGIGFSSILRPVHSYKDRHAMRASFPILWCRSKDTRLRIQVSPLPPCRRAAQPIEPIRRPLRCEPHRPPRHAPFMCRRSLFERRIRAITRALTSPNTPRHLVCPENPERRTRPAAGAVASLNLPSRFHAKFSHIENVKKPTSTALSVMLTWSNHTLDCLKALNFGRLSSGRFSTAL
jgi:hypothetical protein